MSYLPTGKNKVKFEEWYIQEWIPKHRPDYVKYSSEQNVAKFYRKTVSEQFGVLLEYYNDEEKEISYIITGALAGSFAENLLSIKNDKPKDLFEYSLEKGDLIMNKKLN